MQRLTASIKNKTFYFVSLLLALALTSGSVSAASGAVGRGFFQSGEAHYILSNASEGAITGHVMKSGDNTAIAHAVVVAQKGTDVFLSTSTDANGMYSLQGLMAGTYQVSAIASGYASASVGNVTVTAGGTTTLDFLLNVAPAPTTAGSMNGQVLTTGGLAISDASVLLVQDAMVKYATQADTNGLYLFSTVAVGSYTAIIFAPEHRPMTQANITIAANTATTVNFTLTPVPLPGMGSIAGKITKAANGDTLAAAQVAATLGSEVVATATSDPNGNYALNRLATGAYSLRVTAAGYQTTTLGDVQVSANTTTTANFALALLPPPPAPQTDALTGKVVDAKTGKAIAGALEVLKLRVPLPLIDGEHEELVVEAMSNADGAFSFSGLEPGIYTLKVKAEGYHSIKIGGIAILAGESAVINVALKPKEVREPKKEERRGSIVGVVMAADGNIAIEGATVFFTPSRGQDKDGHDRRFVRTDSNGKFVLEGLLIGTYQVQVLAKGFLPAKEKDVQVKANERTEVNFELRATPERDDKVDKHDQEKKNKEADKAKFENKKDDD